MLLRLGHLKFKHRKRRQFTREECALSVVEQHVKIFVCDGCKLESEQEPSVSQVEGWVRISARSGSATQLWDLCSWECASSLLAGGEPEAAGLVIEDAPVRRGRRRGEP